MFEIKPDLSAEYILSRLTQEEIFEHYLGIEPVFNVLFCSPIRSDKKPTCNFKWVGSYLQYRDWAETNMYNCFGIVMKLYNCSYHESLEIIYEDLIDGTDKRIRHMADSSVRLHNLGVSRGKQSKKKINISFSKYWQKEVVDYLKSYHLSSDQIRKFQFYPVKVVWLDGRKIYTYNPNDPAFAYYFGKAEDGQERWKVYFFTRRDYRFLGNTNRINGWIQLPENGKQLVITKSLKDVACLDIFNIPSIAMQNEVTIPYDYIIEELNQRFDTIVSLYDFDKTGVTNAHKLKRLYDIPYLFFTNGRFGTKDYGVKDFSDFVQLNGIQKTKQFLNENFFSKDSELFQV